MRNSDAPSWNAADFQLDPAEFDWKKAGGLIPAIVQDCSSGRVLMLGFMNREALNRTLETGRVTFWSRSRRQLWTKGESSGHYLLLKRAVPDCDRDTLLLLAEPVGPTCHQGTLSCFGEDRPAVGLEILGQLERLILSRKREHPPDSYTTRLFREGIHEISKKLGEEAVEVILSVQQGEKRSVEETADLLYHLLVFLADREIPLDQVMQELSARHFGH